MTMVNKNNSIVSMILAICALMLFSFQVVMAEAQKVNGVKPTPYSMDLYGSINGAKGGDVLTVYDEDGVLCGEYLINKDGQYGFLHVYGDDKTTKGDEGAEKNEPLTFKLNGAPIEPSSGKAVNWLGDGRALRVDF